MPNFIDIALSILDQIQDFMSIFAYIGVLFNKI